MSNPGYPPPGYPPPGYPVGYQPYPPPGYQGFPPPAYKPGVIPLRPLSLTDILNGAFSYIRSNPKATLGLTTIVVVIAQLIGLIVQIGPLATMGELGVLRGEEGSTAAAVGEAGSNIASTLTTLLASIVLSGMLTVIVGRAVFGATITIGDAWRRVRGRLLPLFGFVLLWVLAVAVPIVVVVIAIAVAASMSGAVAFVIAIPLVLGVFALLVYLWTVLSFVPPLIVLERLPIFAAIQRSFRLIKGDFWRVLGIRLLATLVAGVVAAAVAIPFSIVGQLMLLGSESTATIPVALVLIAFGGAVGQIITAPFSAGAVVLIYTDRRIRAEAFDLVLQTGATMSPPGTAPDSTDHLWLTRQP